MFKFIFKANILYVRIFYYFFCLLQFLINNLSVDTMYEVKVRAGTYSRYYIDNNITYKGLFSKPRKILLFKGCHKEPIYEPRPPLFEMSAGIVAGIICAAFAIFLLVIAMILWRLVVRVAISCYIII